MSEIPNGFDTKASSTFLLKAGHVGWLGLEYLGHGADWVEVKLPWRDDLIGDPDQPVLASGPIVSLLDMASGLSIWTRKQAFVPIATLDLRVDYQRPAKDHKPVTGHAECYRTTRSAAFVRGYAHDGDPSDPVAHMAGVFMTLDHKGAQKNG